VKILGVVRDDLSLIYVGVHELLDAVVNHSPRTFYELKVNMFIEAEFELEWFPRDLEPILTSWANHMPQKSLSLTLKDVSEIMEINEAVIENLKGWVSLKKFKFS